MMIRVTHALSDEPEVFSNVFPALDRGVLLLSSTPDGLRVVQAFNTEAWAHFEVIG